MQVSSSPMQKQDSVHGRLVLEQEQFARHIDLLHWQVVSSKRLFGAGSLVISTGFNISHLLCTSHDFLVEVVVALVRVHFSIRKPDN